MKSFLLMTADEIRDYHGEVWHSRMTWRTFNGTWVHSDIEESSLENLQACIARIRQQQGMLTHGTSPVCRRM